MIVFVKISPRRYIAVDTDKFEHGWRNATPGYAPAATPDSVGLIYTTGTIIAGPANWTTMEQATIAYAKRNLPEKLMPYTEWKAIEDARQDRIKAANAGLGAGAVLARPKGDEEP